MLSQKAGVLILLNPECISKLTPEGIVEFRGIDILLEFSINIHNMSANVRQTKF